MATDCYAVSNMPIKHFGFHKSDPIAIKYSELFFDTDSAEHFSFYTVQCTYIIHILENIV